MLKNDFLISAHMTFRCAANTREALGLSVEGIDNFCFIEVSDNETNGIVLANRKIVKMRKVLRNNWSLHVHELVDSLL